MHACVLYVCHRACLCRKVVTCGNLPATVSSLQSTSESFHSNQGWQKTLFQNVSCMFAWMYVKEPLHSDHSVLSTGCCIVFHHSSSYTHHYHRHHDDTIIGLFWEVWYVLELLYTRVNLFKIYKIYFKISLLN
jgi:hypothetical protein